LFQIAFIKSPIPDKFREIDAAKDTTFEGQQRLFPARICGIDITKTGCRVEPVYLIMEK
jgi:hypothetical protein